MPRRRSYDHKRFAYDPFQRCSIGRGLELCEDISARIVKATGGDDPRLTCDAEHVEHLAALCRKGLRGNDAHAAAILALRVGVLLENMCHQCATPELFYAHQQRRAHQAGGRTRRKVNREGLRDRVDRACAHGIPKQKVFHRIASEDGQNYYAVRNAYYAEVAAAKSSKPI